MDSGDVDQTSTDPRSTTTDRTPSGPRAPRGPMRRLLQHSPWLVELTWSIVFLLTQTVVIGRSVLADAWISLGLELLTLPLGVAGILLRRRRPWLTLGIGLLGTLVLIPLTGNDLLLLAALALYTLAVHRSSAAAWRGFAIAGVSVTLVMGLGALGVLDTDGALVPTPVTYPPDDVGLEIATGGLIVLTLAVVTLAGSNVGNRRRYVQALVDRAADLERERDQRARLAVAEERGRIAREMHDVVAHSLSIMVALADGASQTADVAQARAASAQAAETGREALVEMRHVLRVLDPSDTGDLRPQPGMADLPPLMADVRATGLPVAVTYAHGLDLPPTVSLTVYRLVQESLTNVLRHSRQPQDVQVLLVAVDEHLEIEVNDDGREPTRSPRGESAGRGLMGMRERVSSLGGELSVGPRVGGGWRVRARLPLPADGQPVPTSAHRYPVTRPPVWRPSDERAGAAGRRPGPGADGDRDGPRGGPADRGGGRGR